MTDPGCKLIALNDPLMSPNHLPLSATENDYKFILLTPFPSPF